LKTADYAIAEQYGKWCGKWTAKGRSFDGSEVRYQRVHCKCWHCAHCAPKRAGAYRRGITAAAEAHGLTKFLTLTLDPKKLGGNAEHSCKHLRESFNKFRTYLRRKYGETVKYIAVLEFQQNGFAHLHLILDRYIPQAWIKKSWAAVGGGEHVDIRRVDEHRVAKYLAKYLTKQLNSDAPKGQRRVTCSRGIKLLVKLVKKHNWLLMRESIRWVFMRRCAVASGVVFDRNEVLQGFAVKTTDGGSLISDSPGYGCWEAC
jgi:hypothetical protein